jgi:uncharacterized membrane-anchored protein YhcB (DUF1043 family)
MWYVAVAMISGTIGFLFAALMCASGRADLEAELFRLYEVLKQYKEILNDHQNNKK